MRVTCICVCHDKPDVAHEALRSIVDQTHTDWEAIIVDSGVLYDAGYYQKLPWLNDPRIKLIRSNETDETRRTKAMAPWCFNECFRQGLVTGDLVVYLCDDDLLYPKAFETFVSYCRERPDAQAMYASQDLGIVYPNGWHAIVGERRVNGPGGRSCNGRRMDCEIDYLQFCHRTEVLKRFPDHEYWPESKSTEEHADGIFMERVGALVPIHPIDVKVSQNRRTPRSLNIPMSPLSLMDCMANGIPLLADNSVQMADRGLAATNPLVTIAVVCGHETQALSYSPIEVIRVEVGSMSSWNRALNQARGEYFLPLAHGHNPMPDAVERLLNRLLAHPRLSAVSCYLLGVQNDSATMKPLVSVKNVMGCALYRTADLRAVGGFDPNADASSGEWSAFFKLVNAGRHVDILPEHLFWAADEPDAVQADNLKPFVAMDRVLAAERESLWKAMAGYERRLHELVRDNRLQDARLQLLRYRIADRIFSFIAKIPFLVRGLKRLFGQSTVCPQRKQGNVPVSPQRKQGNLLGNVQPLVPKNASAAP